MFTRSKRPTTRNYSPSLCILEDRTVPSGFRLFTGPAVDLKVIAPAQVQAGQTFNVEVEALSSSGAVASGFTGTVQLSLGTSDPGATLPSFTFTTANGGIHYFQVTLTRAGSQTIAAEDAAAGSTIAGSAKTTVKQGAVAGFTIVAPSDAAVGTPTSVTVEATDAFGNVVTNFTGAVHLSAANSNLPSSYTFVAGDHGEHTFNVTFKTAGSETVSATSAASSAMTGEASLLVYNANQATHFDVTVLGSASAGMPTEVEVTALNAGNQTATGYLGLVRLTSSDPYASLLSSYQFTASNKGIYLFDVVFATPGTQTITATDLSNASITGMAAATIAAQTAAYYGSQGYYGNGYYGSSYYAPGYYGNGYGIAGYYGTGYYGSPGYYGSGYYGIAGNYPTGLNSPGSTYY